MLSALACLKKCNLQNFLALFKREDITHGDDLERQQEMSQGILPKCPSCFTAFEPEINIQISLDCKHYICSECLKSKYGTQSGKPKCPTCRKYISQKVIQQHILSAPNSMETFSDPTQPATPLYDYSFKYLVLGEVQVGKTSLIQRFTGRGFSEKYEPTMGGVFSNRILEVDGKKVQLDLWDISGHDRYHGVTISSNKLIAGAILCYDITDKDTFLKAKALCQDYEKNYPSAHFILVGTKSDKSAERKVTQEEVLSWVINKGALYFECSAKENTGIEDMFQKIAHKALLVAEKQQKASVSNVIVVPQIKKPWWKFW